MHTNNAARFCPRSREHQLFENGEIWGDNTDGLGFVAHLDAVHPGWEHTNRRTLLLGAGGGARGLAMPLLERKPLRLAFSNRSGDRLGKLVEDLKKVVAGCAGRYRAVGSEGSRARRI